QTMINVRLPADNGGSHRLDIEHDPMVRRAVEEAESELAEHGRVVLRPSGTEPVIRVMVEGNDPEQVARVGEHLADAVKAAAHKDTLRSGVAQTG
ncbi:MAG: hypothetical protein OEQ18_10940, partial [Gammaproteobacteria bacterium]|nr:hypothetical protein [Gammaproteobacteria bacterium]